MEIANVKRKKEGGESYYEASLVPQNGVGTPLTSSLPWNFQTKKKEKKLT